MSSRNGDLAIDGAPSRDERLRSVRATLFAASPMDLRSSAVTPRKRVSAWAKLSAAIKIPFLADPYQFLQPMNRRHNEGEACGSSFEPGK
jgi:hypothetical protein